MSIFEETRTPEKRGGEGGRGKGEGGGGAENVQNKEENQQQAQLTYDREEPGFRTRGTLVGGECITIPSRVVMGYTSRVIPTK